MVVRPNPVLFRLPKSAEEETKENPTSLPYRSVFAVLTLDSVLVYDTHHDQPLSVSRGLHYAGLTDCCWSEDGLNLMVCSTDGYISILSFQDGELGPVYTPPVEATAQDEESARRSSTAPTISEVKVAQKSTSHVVVAPENLPVIAPCEAGQTAVLEGPPAKRAKTRIAPTLVMAPGSESGQMTPAKRSLASDAEQVGDAVNKLSLGSAAEASSSTDVKPVKKKKRIQPLLVSN